MAQSGIQDQVKNKQTNENPPKMNPTLDPALRKAHKEGMER